MAMNQRQVVVGVFDDRSRAEQAIQELRDIGFTDDQIGFAVRRGEGQAGAGYTGTEAPAGETGAGGAAKGVITGGVLGGILGAGAALLIPGFGPVIAGGILAATLGGAAIGAAAGGLLGALTDMGVPEEEARYYQSEFEAGRIVVTVKTTNMNEQQQAMAILRRNGAYDATTRRMEAVGGTTGMAAMGTGEQERAMPIREEQLRVEKQPVEAGEVRIGKEVVEEEKTVNVPVTREQVYVEERPVQARPADRPIEEGEAIRVPVREEQVHVEKQPVVTGEVVIGKQAQQETQQVQDTIRREEPRIEREGDVDVRGADVNVREQRQPEG
jgi:uncharacterized protein (TIGR02271 family)